MTRILRLFLYSSLFLSIAAYADEVSMPAFAPKSPISMGQGGSISSVATGYEALFTNPAGFATSEREWIISPATFWINGEAMAFLVSSGLFSAPSAYDGPTTTFGDETGYADYFGRTAEDGGGYGGSWGIGFVGKGLGLGVISSTELFLSGSPFPSGVEGYFLSDLSFIGGYTFVPIKGDFFSWSIGADIRPSIRLYAPLTAESFLAVVAAKHDDSLSDAAYTAALNGVDLYQGAAVALDAGTRLSFGNVTFSLAIRDFLDTRYSMQRYGYGNWLEELKDDRRIPDSGKDPDGAYIVPMSAVAGLAYHPDLGSFSRYVDPVFHIDLEDPLVLLRQDDDLSGLLHIGTEIGLYRIFKLRAGYDRGSLTAGGGLRLAFFQFDVALFSDAWGQGSQAVPSSGLSLALSFRF